MLAHLEPFGVSRLGAHDRTGGSVRLVFRDAEAGALAGVLDAWCRGHNASYRLGPVTLEEVYTERVGHAFESADEPAAGGQT